MLGAIIGDTVGSAYEFHNTKDYNFTLFLGNSGYTDDSIMTMAVAYWLIMDKEHSYQYLEDRMVEFAENCPCPMGGYGGRFAQWVRSKDPQPYNSFGNGSAMRVSPIGMWFGKREDVLEQAKKTAECSHNHPEGIKGAQTVALAIYQAIILREEIKYGIEGMKELMAYATTFSKYHIDIRKEDVENRFDETCQGTVPVALWVIYNSRNYENAIRKAVSLGADADTLGAIVGGIAEAIWGVPEEMKQRVMTEYLPSEMKEVIDVFYEQINK